jgi:hypothetical protein
MIRRRSCKFIRPVTCYREYNLIHIQAPESFYLVSAMSKQHWAIWKTVFLYINVVLSNIKPPLVTTIIGQEMHVLLFPTTTFDIISTMPRCKFT